MSRAKRTIRAAVLGGDVSRSRSPDIHHAAWKALGRSGRYEAISLPARDFRATVRRLARAGYAYLNVTIPHKHLAARLADRTSPIVKMTGAANTLVFRARGIFADNTDGAGLVDALADAGARVDRYTVAVLVGSGGAAAGALHALVHAGAQVRLLARRRAPALALCRHLPTALRERVTIATLDRVSLARALDGATILVSAVPAAAWRSAAARAGLAHLGRRTVVLEMAYGAPTPLGRAVRTRIARYQDGLPMLVHQARHAVGIALGRKPPVAPLYRSVNARARAGSH